MSYREPERDEGPETAYLPCGVCGVVQADHGHRPVLPWFNVPRHCRTCGEVDTHPDHSSHDWEPPSDNSPDEPEED